MVTANVDNFQFYDEITVEESLFLDGYVTSVGRTTIEVRIDISGKETGKFYSSCFYLFAARHRDDHSKGFEVPKLIFEGERDPQLCQERQELGEKNQQARKDKMKQSLYNQPPTSEEIALIHKLFQESEKLQNLENQGHSLFLHESRLEKNILMHYQNQNIHGKIFGGLLMREAYELGYMAALLQGDGTHPTMYYLNDVTFFKPVEIGSATKFVGSYFKN